MTKSQTTTATATNSLVTDADIASLRDESANQGDMEQVKLCDAALNGDLSAWKECVRVIRANRAQV